MTGRKSDYVLVPSEEFRQMLRAADQEAAPAARTETHRKERARARREVFGRLDGEKALRPIAAFNAGFDAGRGYVEMPAGHDPSRPNHYFHDGAGDPATCTQDHNHPEAETA